MKVCYLCSSSLSYRKAAVEYIKCLELLGVELTRDPEEASLVIIHDDPPAYLGYFKKYPCLADKYTVACALWKADLLPPAYCTGLALVDEIWTPSRFTAEVFRQQFGNVKQIPYVVPTRDYDSGALGKMIRRLDYDRDCYYFYTITDAVNPRKDLFLLIEAFSEVFAGNCEDVRLVVKQYRQFVPLDCFPQVICIEEMLTNAEIGALHHLADCYVSPHHAEAWGLSLADALAAGNEVVATGYSGNMDYMHRNNSFPVAYTLRPILARDRVLQPKWLREDILWAYASKEDLIAKMNICYRGLHNLDLEAGARQIRGQYSHEAVAGIITERYGQFAAIRPRAAGTAL